MKLKALLFILSFQISIALSQTQKPFVYAGASFPYTVNGMSRIDHSFYFRTDGSFCDELDKENWQTRVDGRYKIQGKFIVLNYSDPEEEQDTIEFENANFAITKETGYYYGGRLVRMTDANYIPIGIFEYSYASSSGGNHEGAVNIFSSGQKSLEILPGGRFIRDGQSGVVISAQNVGGGVSNTNKQAGAGKYSLDKGLITFFYDDGRKLKSSFFYDVDSVETMLVFDGDLYFYKPTTENKNDVTAKTSVNKSEQTKGENKADFASKLLEKTKEVHGGRKIDEIKTIKFEFETSGIKFIAMQDIAAKKIRIQSITSGFEYIEQSENTTGWLKTNGIIKTLKLARIKELQNSLVSGIHLLRANNLSKAEIIDTKPVNDSLFLITWNINDVKAGLFINKETGVIFATSITKDDGEEISMLSDYRKDQGLLLPFTEVSKENNQTIRVNYKSYQINPILTAKDWEKPN